MSDEPRTDPTPRVTPGLAPIGINPAVASSAEGLGFAIAIAAANDLIDLANVSATA